MSAIKQRSMFAAEKVGQNAAGAWRGRSQAQRRMDGQDRACAPDHHRLLRLAGQKAAHGRIRQHGIQRVSGAGA